MIAGFSYIVLPLLACFLLVSIYVYLGHHVLRRGVIFVDIAIAQIAVLGLTFAFYLGFEPRSYEAYFYALVFSIAGAALFAFAKPKEEVIPQEAVIGICYVVATGISILLVEISKDPHGGDHIKYMLVGHITLVIWRDIVQLLSVLIPVGLFHILFFKKFYAVTFEPEKAKKEGLSPALWDFLFYVTFGFVVTTSVKICGVLLVFSFLVIPATCASLFAKTFRWRLMLGWMLGWAVSFFGLLFSWELSSGPMIVFFFGIVLALVGAFQYIARSQKKTLALGKLIGSLATFALVLYGIPQGSHLLGLKESHHHHQGEEEDHHDHETKGPQTAVIPKKESEFSKILKDLQNLDPFASYDEMEKLCHKWGQEKILKNLSKLLEGAKTQKDENLKLNVPKLLLHYQNKGGAGLLIEVLEKSEGSMVREEALRVLKKAAGKDFGYDPFLGAEENKKALAKWKEWWKRIMKN